MDTKKRYKELKRNLGKGGDIYAYAPEKKKKKKSKIDQHGVYQLTTGSLYLHLIDLAFMSNGILEGQYLGKTYIRTGNKNICLNKRFKNLSRLDWEKNADIHSMTYRGRFATCLEFYMIDHIKEIVSDIYKTSYKDDHVKKYKNHNQMLNKILVRIDMCITGLLSRDLSYKEPFISLYEMMMLGGYSQGDLLPLLKPIMELDDLIDSTEDDGIKINNILKSGYILATLSAKTKKCPKYMEGDYRKDVRMEDQIGKLGFAIMHAHKKGYVSPYYNLFLKAKPEIYTRFENLSEKPEVCIGCQALAMLDFMSDDQGVSKYIRKMIK